MPPRAPFRSPLFDASRAQGATSSLRWLILASLGCAASSACGGRTLFDEQSGDDDLDMGFGGSAGSANVSRGGSAFVSRGGSGPSLGGNGGSPIAQGGQSSMGGAAGSAMAYGGSAGSGLFDPIVPGPCDQPSAWGNGFEQCETGVLHRPAFSQGQCPTDLPRAEALDAAEFAEIERMAQERGLSLAETLVLLPCTADSDCTAAPNGHCELAGAYTNNLTECLYGCTQDYECGSGNVCLCGAPVGRCVNAECQTDGDCGGDLLCTMYEARSRCGETSSTNFACQTPLDECLTDADCGDYVPYCTPSGDGRRLCTGDPGCMIGRPFFVDGQLRVAAPASRADWLAATGLSKQPVQPLLANDPALRRELAAAWTELGLMEHASVASFARFALHLLSLGAPPDLLEAATRAMQDETRHAQACFALASRYGQRDVGPGRLNLEDALGPSDLESIVLMAVHEGCIGETAAALEATEAAEHCIDAPTRHVLEQIAREEAEHAELAWRFVAWALNRSPSALTERVRRAFQAELVPSSGDGDSPSAPSALASTLLRERQLLAFGIVGRQKRSELRQQALREAILPCAEVLLARAHAPSSTGLPAGQKPKLPLSG